MKTIAAATITLCFIVGTTAADEVQLFNTDIFGHRTSEAVKLLVDRGSDQVEPYVVWADVSCGKYFAGSAFYRKPLRIADVVAQIERLYPRSNVVPERVWRVTGKGFGVQLADETEGDAVRVTFISFSNEPCGQPSESGK